jgi:hypothetical protein
MLPRDHRTARPLAVLLVACLGCGGSAPAGGAPLAVPAATEAGTGSTNQPGMRPLAASAVVLETQQGPYTEPTTSVVRDAAGMQSLWTQLHAGTGAPALPTVDFGRDMLVLVALGQQSSGGHALSVLGTSTGSDGALVVHARHAAPGPDCMTTQALTAPAVVVRVPRQAGAVRVDTQRVSTPC